MQVSPFDGSAERSVRLDVVIIFLVASRQLPKSFSFNRSLGMDIGCHVSGIAPLHTLSDAKLQALS